MSRNIRLPSPSYSAASLASTEVESQDTATATATAANSDDNNDGATSSAAVAATPTSSPTNKVIIATCPQPPRGRSPAPSTPRSSSRVLTEKRRRKFAEHRRNRTILRYIDWDLIVVAGGLPILATTRDYAG